MKRKGLLGCFAALLILIAIIGLLVYSFPSMLKPGIAKKVIVKIDLSGELLEYNPEILWDFMGARKPTVFDLVRGLDGASNDPRVQAVILRPRSLQIGPAKIQEIHQAILRYRKSGKPILAYLDMANDIDLKIAAATGKIIMSPGGFLLLNGITAEALYPKKLFDKLGIEFQMVRFGRYKSAAEFFTHEQMSPEAREMVQWLLDSLSHQDQTVMRTLRPGMTQPWPELIKQGFFVGQTALDWKVVDRLEGWSDFKSSFKEKTEGDWVSLSRYLENLPKPKATVRCALVFAVGSIIDGTGTPGKSIGSDSYVKYFREILEDDELPCILIRDDSPGGSGLASDHIWTAIEQLKKAGKTVVISMSDVAGSGGYYIAMNAHKIVAQPGTLTGSIGVFTGKVILHNSMDKLGIHVETLKGEEGAGFWSPFTPLNPEQLATLQSETEKFYRRFVSLVAQGRRKKVKDIEPVAEGRVWTGEQALKRGLVDSLGGFHEASQILIKLLKKDPEKSIIQWVIYPKKRTFFEILSDYLSARTDILKQAGVRDPSLRARLLPYTTLLNSPIAAVMPPVWIH